jgi:hypothetical protein
MIEMAVPGTPASAASAQSRHCRHESRTNRSAMVSGPRKSSAHLPLYLTQMSTKENPSAAISRSSSGLGRDIATGPAEKGNQSLGTDVTLGEIAERQKIRSDRRAHAGYEFGQNGLNKQNSAHP